MFKLVNLDSTSDSKSLSLSSPQIKLGRGDFYCEKDRRISRQHVELKIHQNGTNPQLQLIPLHKNPCFYKTQPNLTLLNPVYLGNTQLLNAGDHFGLHQDVFWFRIDMDDLSDQQDVQTLKMDESEEVKIKMEQEEIEDALNNDVSKETIENPDNPASPSILAEVVDDAPCEKQDVAADGESSEALKRHREPSEDAPSSKRARSSSPVDVKPDVASLQMEVATSSATSEEVKQENTVETGIIKIESVVKEEPKDGTEDEAKKDPEAAQTSAMPDVQQLSTSKQCMYGASCYRRNPQHRSEYAHPGDPEWGQQPPCQYGALCYRRSRQHRAAYSHPGPPADRPNNPGWNREYFCFSINLPPDFGDEEEWAGDSADSDYEF